MFLLGKLTIIRVITFPPLSLQIIGCVSKLEYHNFSEHFRRLEIVSTVYMDAGEDSGNPNGVAPSLPPLPPPPPPPPHVSSQPLSGASQAPNTGFQPPVFARKSAPPPPVDTRTKQKENDLNGSYPSVVENDERKNTSSKGNSRGRNAKGKANKASA